MSSLTFKALIDGVRFDPKKGALKIQLIAASHVSMDKLTTLGPSDESIRVTLESEQTEIETFPLVPGTSVAIKGGEKWLKKAADVLWADGTVEAEEEEGRIITEFSIEKEPSEDGEE